MKRMIYGLLVAFVLMFAMSMVPSTQVSSTFSPTLQAQSDGCDGFLSQWISDTAAYMDWSDLNTNAVDMFYADQAAGQPGSVLVADLNYADYTAGMADWYLNAAVTDDQNMKAAHCY